MNPIPDPLPRAPIPARESAATVLIVDDETLIRKLLTLILGKLGYKVLCAATAAQAVEFSDASPRENFGVMITDLWLPGTSGVALASKLRADRPDLKVLYISGSTREHFNTLCVDMSQASFIAKPFTATQLAEALRSLIERQSCLC